MKFNTKSVKGLINIAKTFGVQHGPEILIALGITGMGTATVLAVKATPKALEQIDDEIDRQNDERIAYVDEHEEEIYHPVEVLSKKEVIKVCWKGYLPAIITGVTSIFCIVGGTSINLRRNAALATAYKISEASVKELMEYKDKVVETIGEDKNKEIEDKIDQEHLDRASINMDSSTITGKGPILYFDKMGGQWFKSDKESIREAINNLNRNMNSDMYVSLNDFYDELDMPHTIAGDSLGWNSDQGLIEFKFNPMITKSGVPAVVFSTRLDPRADYTKLM